MKKFSTQCMDQTNKTNNETRKGKKSMPRKQTIDFLMQFARTYYVEPSVTTQLNGFVMN